MIVLPRAAGGLRLQQQLPRLRQPCIEAPQLRQRRLDRAEDAPLVRIHQPLEHERSEAGADRMVVNDGFEEDAAALAQLLGRRARVGEKGSGIAVDRLQAV